MFHDHNYSLPLRERKTWLGSLLPSKSCEGAATLQLRGFASHTLTQPHLGSFLTKVSYPSPVKGEGQC
jgi:hypothetical protein